MLVMFQDFLQLTKDEKGLPGSMLAARETPEGHELRRGYPVVQE